MREPSTWSYDAISSNHIKLFRILGILPLKGHSMNFIGTQFLPIYFCIVNLFYGSMFASYGIKMIVLRSWEIDYVCEMLTGISLFSRFSIILAQRQHYRRLMQSCGELWKNLIVDESKTMRRFERELHYFRSFFLCNAVIIVTLFLISSARLTKLPPATINATERKQLPMGFYLDVQEEPTYTMALIFQAFVLYNMSMVLTGTETAGLYLILMACGFLRTLQNRLLSMSQVFRSLILIDHAPVESVKEEDKLSVEAVLVCAKFHQNIMIFCEEIEHFLRSLYMISVICSAYSISLMGMKLLENDEYIINYISILILNFMQLFICQWGPEHLLSESKAIANASYFAALAHLEYEKKPNKILFFIILRAQKPIQLTAGGFINLSMETFGHMIRNIFSFFTLIRSCNN